MTESKKPKYVDPGVYVKEANAGSISGNEARISNFPRRLYDSLQSYEDRDCASYEKEPESYLERHQACGLKVGDRVKVTRKAVYREGGWDRWIPSMSDAVGETAVILLDRGIRGFKLKFDSELSYAASYSAYPYFVLEKVEEEKKAESQEDDEFPYYNPYSKKGFWF